MTWTGNPLCLVSEIFSVLPYHHVEQCRTTPAKMSKPVPIGWKVTATSSFEFKFYLPDSGETAEDSRTIPTPCNSEDPRVFAEQAATWYHSRNGWDRWPIELTVIINDGTEQTFIVDRQMVPDFWAKLKP